MSEEPARRRVLAAALHCFARKGFAGTTIVDIEREAGLSPGAGGTYRHFSSKRAMLEAAVTEALARTDEELAPTPTSLADAARGALTRMDELRDLTKIVLRDLDRFPDLLGPVVDRLLDGPVRIVAERTADAMPDSDADAIAAILVGGLVNVKVIEAIAGHRPGAVTEDRLVDAWVRLYTLLLKDRP